VTKSVKKMGAKGKNGDLLFQVWCATFTQWHWQQGKTVCIIMGFHPAAIFAPERVSAYKFC